MVETQSFYIPPEIITAILLFLPPRALMKFICVCKTWKSLMTNSSFVTDYSKISTSKGIPVHECLHWFSNSKISREKVILSFDFVKEKFNKIGMPNFGDGADNDFGDFVKKFRAQRRIILKVSLDLLLIHYDILFIGYKVS
ncbi:hypothetical protein M9H77_24448 [Catharanthus roseus]|uniref:Uncharacterized protein n=1 Tax=Catharanthus roseus TaxID=4058 RepID=A0ACC0AW76_CATRO|nr:hypothetical protein M9H77_24448 [Catharanthus roseus]